MSAEESAALAIERVRAVLDTLAAREGVQACEEHPPADFQNGVLGCIDCVLWVTEQGTNEDLKLVRSALSGEPQRKEPIENQSWFRQEYERSKRRNAQQGPYGGMVITGTGFDVPTRAATTPARTDSTPTEGES